MFNYYLILWLVLPRRSFRASFLKLLPYVREPLTSKVKHNFVSIGLCGEFSFVEQGYFLAIVQIMANFVSLSKAKIL